MGFVDVSNCKWIFRVQILYIYNQYIVFEQEQSQKMRLPVYHYSPGP
jgi:hypothetical protein